MLLEHGQGAQRLQLCLHIPVLFGQIGERIVRRGLRGVELCGALQGFQRALLVVRAQDLRQHHLDCVTVMPVSDQLL